MNEFVTPKQVARAIQVSESSVKRWCDRGVIPNQKTAGGHRRIPLSGLMEFLRESNQRLVRPEVIGLPATTGQTERVIGRAAAQITEALLQGDEQSCRRITLDLYLAEHTISTICDQVFARAFAMIGERWECGDAEVYQERAACELTLHLLSELRLLIPPPPDDAPLAIGAAVEGDQYALGTAMAEIVLRDAKWNALSLGSNLPFRTLAEAIASYRPRLFWISCSHIIDEERFLRGYSQLYDQFGMQVAFIVGGQSLIESLRQKMKYAAYGDTMQHLETFTQSLRGATARSDK